MLFSSSIHALFHSLPNLSTVPSGKFHELCLLSPALTEARLPENIFPAGLPSQASFSHSLQWAGLVLELALVTDPLLTPKDKLAFLWDADHLATPPFPSSLCTHLPITSPYWEFWHLPPSFHPWVLSHPGWLHCTLDFLVSLPLVLPAPIHSPHYSQRET